MQKTSRIILTITFVLFLSVSLVTCVGGVGLYLWARQDGLNPIKAISLRISLTRNEDALNTPAGVDPSYQEFVVNSGESATLIAGRLQQQGLISDVDLFVDYVEYYGLAGQLEAGTFYLQQTMTIEGIAYALTDASTATIAYRTLAGWRLEEIAEETIATNPLLDFTAAEFYNAVGPGVQIPADFRARMGIPELLSTGVAPSLEGFMYPGDYKLRPGITPQELADTLLLAFDTAITDEMLQQAAQQGLTMYQVVTLAAIVQREAVVVDEAPLIASVYLNRLSSSMRLDADPTVQYAIGFRDGRWWPRLSGEPDYYALGGAQANYAYNTYLMEDGLPLEDLLPPGPICSPGMAAIRAVLAPAQTEYLYFRSCDDRSHIFSTTLAEHSSITCP